MSCWCTRRFRAIRPVEGGPLGLIEALRDVLGPSGTLVMPSFSGDDDEPFDPATTPASPDLGIVADMFWRLPGVLRSNHCHAFAAIGTYAAVITADPLPLPPHIPASPAGRVHDLDGQVLLLGVGHDADTMLHLAEVTAGVPYRVPKHCMVLQDGSAIRIDYEENDHCCERFSLADGWLRAARPAIRRTHRTRLMRGSRAPATSSRSPVEKLERDDRVFLHPPDAGCAECDAARRSVGR